MIPETVSTIIDAIRKDHVRINSVTTVHETQEQQKICIAEIEELKQNEGEDDHSEDADVEAGVYSILVNKIPL